MIVAYPFRVRDSTVTSGNNRITGLVFGGIGVSPGMVQCKTLANPPVNVPTAALPVPVEVGEGEYLLLYDAEVNGEAIVQLDAGVGLTNPSDRYIDIPMTRDSSRLQTGFNAAGDLAQSALDTILVETQQIIGGETIGMTLNLRQAIQICTARASGNTAGATQTGGLVTVSAAGGPWARLQFEVDQFGNVKNAVLIPSP